MPPDAALNTCILVSLLCWGAWGIFDKIALQHAPESLVMLGLFAFSFPCAVITLILLNVYQPGWTVTPEIIFWTGLGFVSYGIAMICYLGALNITEASYVLGATASYPVILQFLSAYFLGEALVPARIGGSLLVAAGVTLIGTSVSKDPSKAVPKEKKRLLILLVIAATLLWGVWGIFDKKAVNVGGALTAYLAHCVWELDGTVHGDLLLRDRDHRMLSTDHGPSGALGAQRKIQCRQIDRHYSCHHGRCHYSRHGRSLISCLYNV
jgi:drug/metabolite transporter (DMT)-like permease